MKRAAREAKAPKRQREPRVKQSLAGPSPAANRGRRIQRMSERPKKAMADHMQAFPSSPANSDQAGATGMPVGMSFIRLYYFWATAPDASYLLGHLTRSW